MKPELIAALLVLGAPTSAAAHFAPETLGVVLEDPTSGPRMLRTSFGLLVHEDAAWRYICPVRHGGPDAPPAIATGDDRVWLVTIDGAQLVDAQVSALTDKFDAVTVVAVPQLAATSEGAFALVLEGKGSAVYRLREEGPERIFGDREVWESVVAVDGGLLLARTTTSSVVEFAELDFTGTVTSTHALPRLAWELSLHAAPDGEVFAVTTDGRTYLLMQRIDGAMRIVFETTDVIQGVTRIDGRTLASIRGALHWIDEGVATRTGASEEITCLGHTERGVYGCSNLQVYAIDGGQVGEPLFLMPWLEPPSMEGLSVDDAATCDFQWRDLLAETGYAPRPEPAADPAPEPGGCTNTGRPDPWAFVGLVVGIRSFSWLRRRSRRASPCASSRRPSASP